MANSYSPKQITAYMQELNKKPVVLSGTWFEVTVPDEQSYFFRLVSYQVAGRHCVIFQCADINFSYLPDTAREKNHKAKIGYSVDNYLSHQPTLFADTGDQNSFVEIAQLFLDPEHGATYKNRIIACLRFMDFETHLLSSTSFKGIIGIVVPPESTLGHFAKAIAPNIETGSTVANYFKWRVLISQRTGDVLKPSDVFLATGRWPYSGGSTPRNG
jgi:hypothetical protein